MERHFNTSLTRFEAITDIREESTSGNLTFHHPQGVEQWQLPVEPGIRHHRFAHTGGPGTYRLELDWSEHLAGDDLYGVLFGAEPVSSLDEIT